MLILVDGAVIFEWGNTKEKHLVHSIRKALLNSLYGIKIEEGIIDTTQNLLSLGIDDIPNPLTENEKQARIADLLKSRSGVYHHAAAVSEGMLRGMPQRGSYQANEVYYYNNWDFNVLGAILEEKTGESIYKLFENRIAKPLGMLDFKGDFTSVNMDDDEAQIPQTDGFYSFEKSKSKYPAYHFRLSARDLALYGLLYLNKGKWKGKQLISEEWIEKSTTPYSLYNEKYGLAYGMLWNVLTETETRKSRSFYHTGVGIHMLGIYPASKLVLVHRVNTETDYQFHKGNFYEMIRLVWAAQTEQ